MRALLEECILNDPRWDHQLDSRADYYAQLILARRIPLTGLERGMRNEDPESYVSFDESLAVLTMGALVRRADERAVAVLRRYVSYGKHWHIAIEQLREAGRAANWKGLDRVLERRFHSIEEFDKGWPWGIEHQEAPWDNWKAGSGPLAEWLRQREENERQHALEARRLRRAPRGLANLTTSELLDYASQHRLAVGVDKELAKRTSPRDVTTLLAAVDSGCHRRVLTALKALRGNQSDRVFQAARRVIEKERPRVRTFKQRVALGTERWQASLVLERFKPERVLPLARSWRSSPRHLLRRTAYGILEKHATTDDITWLRKQLSKHITPRRNYQLCDLAVIAARFPNHGPFPQLLRIYHGFSYSSGRYFLLRALALTSPDLAHDILIESLWDCEPSVRAIACKHADLTAPVVADRLRELAADPLEEEDVREAASSRLE